MRRLWRWLRGSLIAVVAFIILLLAPIGYTEIACQGETQPNDYSAILPQEAHRAEARTLMTYPEWHIVHAYDDYARVIATGDPHDFGYLQSIKGYWSSLCALTETAANHGGVDGATKQLVYVIGASFTLEMGMKAAYEETLGRIATLIRGKDHAPLDDLSAQQAAEYATFLQQVPWYKWDFEASQAALAAVSKGSFRDRERRLALGIENRFKAAYARAIGAAVASTGADALTLRMIVAAAPDLSTLANVEVIGIRPEGVEIETPRYRALTHVLADMATTGTDVVEIAGNDHILFTATSPKPTAPNAIHTFARQGYGDYRHLILVKVSDLGDALRGLPSAGLTVEHIHDY